MYSLSTICSDFKIMDTYGHLIIAEENHSYAENPFLSFAMRKKRDTAGNDALHAHTLCTRDYPFTISELSMEDDTFILIIEK